MSKDELTLTNRVASLLATVDTQADPDATALKIARRAVQFSGLAPLFEQGAAVEEIATGLAPSLSDFSPEQVQQVALYLKDEHAQFPNKILLTSKKTGRLFAALDPALHLWQPPDVARHGSSKLVQRPREVRPDILGDLIEYASNEEREFNILQWHLEKEPSTLTELDRDGTALQLKVLTRSGREDVKARIAERLKTWPSNITGPERDLLTAITTESTAGMVLKEIPIDFRWRYPIADLKAVNLQFDVVQNTTAVLSIAVLTHTLSGLFNEIKQETFIDRIGQCGLIWCVPPSWPNDHRMERDPDCYLEELVWPTAFPPKAVRLKAWDDPKVDAIEIHDRWEIRVRMTVSVWVDERQIAFLSNGLGYECRMASRYRVGTSRDSNRASQHPS